MQKACSSALDLLQTAQQDDLYKCHKNAQSFSASVAPFWFSQQKVHEVKLEDGKVYVKHVGHLSLEPFPVDQKSWLACLPAPPLPQTPVRQPLRLFLKTDSTKSEPCETSLSLIWRFHRPLLLWSAMSSGRYRSVWGGRDVMKLFGESFSCRHSRDSSRRLRLITQRWESSRDHFAMMWGFSNEKRKMLLDSFASAQLHLRWFEDKHVSCYC